MGTSFNLVYATHILVYATHNLVYATHNLVYATHILILLCSKLLTILGMHRDIGYYFLLVYLSPIMVASFIHFI